MTRFCRRCGAEPTGWKRIVTVWYELVLLVVGVVMGRDVVGWEGKWGEGSGEREAGRVGNGREGQKETGKRANRKREGQTAKPKSPKAPTKNQKPTNL